MGSRKIVPVLGGGVLAGAILNVAGAAVHVMTMGSSRTSLSSMVASLAVGVFSIWLYASLRAHSVPGPRIALVTAVATWLFAYGMVNYMIWMQGTFQGSLMMAYAAIGFGEVAFATLAGAWVCDWAESQATERARKPVLARQFTPVGDLARRLTPAGGLANRFTPPSAAAAIHQ